MNHQSCNNPCPVTSSRCIKKGRRLRTWASVNILVICEHFLLLASNYKGTVSQMVIGWRSAYQVGDLVCCLNVRLSKHHSTPSPTTDENSLATSWKSATVYFKKWLICSDNITLQKYFRSKFGEKNNLFRSTDTASFHLHVDMITSEMSVTSKYSVTIQVFRHVTPT